MTRFTLLMSEHSGFRISLVVLTFAMPLQVSFAQDAAQPNAVREMQARLAALPDTPGTGPFPAIKEETSSLPDHVVYRPANLDTLGSTKLGLYIFGNGACTNDGASARLHLLEIASHGYVAIAPGRIRTGPGASVPPDSSAPPAPRPPAAGALPSLPRPPTSHLDFLSALDWALAQNDDRNGPYYQKIDPKAVAVSGFSCGGLQALQIAADARVKTVVVMNSGIFKPGTGSIGGMDQSKDLLGKLHTPTLYILGGKTDIAYANGMDDFSRINHVPVFMANLLNVGHGGTYWEPNGGKAAAAVVAWLEWQLRGDARAAETFVGKECGLCRDGAWQIEKKRID
jgi:hypothetical protein